ncbi:TraR/DksA family transcriptional regulator [Streptomyces sp. NPDC096310]|uniref:TraR/DksA family transcriptional regulator n=1 Tax=Streptomyces sp. NPDC096310 TaxID=3366082 RepID=UPI0037FB2B54
MVAKKTAAKKTAAKKAAASSSAKETPAKKTAAKKTTAKKAAAKKAAAKKAEAKSTPDTKAPAKKAPGRKAAARKTAAKKAPARKTPASKAPAKQAASAAEGAAQAAEQTGANTVGAKKTAGGTGAAGAAVSTAQVAAAPPGELAVRPGEDPWTPEEVAEARTGLESEIARLSAEITSSEAALAGLMRDSGDGAGDDDADTGTKNITREHEMSLAANAREMLEQTERALLRLDSGTYGLCEVCGKPIGKARMQAFPRATLCVEDKQKQERRG